MPLDPNQPFPTDPYAVQADKFAMLDRRISWLERGGSRRPRRGFGADLSEVSVTGSGFQALGPDVELYVPDGGAFVWIVGELAMRTTDPSGVDVAHAVVHWGLQATVAADDWSGPANVIKPFTAFPFDDLQSEMGNPLVLWIDGGQRTFKMLYSGTSVNGHKTFYSHRRLAVGLW